MSLPENLPKEQYLTALEVATLYRVGVDTVYRHVPCVRIGSVIRYPQSAVDSWIAAQKTPSARARARSPFVNRPKRVKVPERWRTKGEDGK
jgi:predicted DNA-binding transcriptional regulator AlpA